MNKQLKTSLAATAVAVTVIGTGLTSYAMAQDRARLSGGTSSGGGQLANQVSEGEGNAVLDLLSFGISENCQTLLSRTNDYKVHALIIQASNRAAFASKTPAEQEAYRKVIDIEKWAPEKNVWREIAQTKPMVKALLHTTKEQNALAEKLHDAIWAKITKPTPAVIKETPMLGLSQEEKLREQQNPPASKAVQLHRKWLDAQLNDAMKQVRASLTKEQGAEWDGILALYNRYLPKMNP